MKLEMTREFYENWKDTYITHDEDVWDGAYKTYGEMWEGEEYEIVIQDRHFEIYQLVETEATHNLFFRGYKELEKHNLKVSAENYQRVYKGRCSDDTTLDDLYTIFNVAHPSGFTGHSLSVSDIVVIRDGDIKTAYYVDNFGFKEVPEFFN